MPPDNINDCSMDRVPPTCEDVWGATGVWFNGKSITQHGTAKGALNSLLLPIFALNSARQAANEIQRNTDATGCSTSGIQLPLINAASLSQRAKSALERAAARWCKNFFCTRKSTFVSANFLLRLPNECSGAILSWRYYFSHKNMNGLLFRLLCFWICQVADIDLV